MFKKCLFLGYFIFLGLYAQSQDDVITLKNPSFEDTPHAGGEFNIIKDWQDCGVKYFPGETAPDIHLGMARDTNIATDKIYFGVKQPASDGFSFLGFVVRNNDTYESMSQRLSQPIEAGKCYSFSIDLSRSLSYTSPYPDLGRSLKYTQPTVLRIYGGSSDCNRRELLAESSAVSNTDWQTYEFTFEPTLTHRYFTISAFYKVPIMFPYNGNLLIDNASEIKQIPCPNEEIIAENVEKPVQKPKEEVKKPKKDPVVKKEPEVVTEVKPEPKKEPKVQPSVTINKELNRKFLKKGQKIKIKNLYFDADSIVINPKSKPALEELATFLKYNNDIRLEIGGHTNGQPPSHQFCDSLSEARAKNVAQFLYDEGIPLNQISYKGYGKRIPIATNKTKEGRRRNQRVEIKVLDIGSDK